MRSISLLSSPAGKSYRTLMHLFLDEGSIRKGDADGWTAILPGKCDFSDVKKHRKLVAVSNPDSTRTEFYILSNPFNGGRCRWYCFEWHWPNDC